MDRWFNYWSTYFSGTGVNIGFKEGYEYINQFVRADKEPEQFLRDMNQTKNDLLASSKDIVRKFLRSSA